MKQKRFTLSALLVAMFCMQQVHAQNDVTAIFRAGIGDLEKVATGYVKPLGVGLSAGMGGNWYNTAANHKTLGFDITLGAGVLFVPSKDQNYDLSGFEKLQVTDGKTTAPSFAGNGDGANLEWKQKTYYYNSNKDSIPGKSIIKFKTPAGVTNILPSAVIQGTIGLPKGTDLSIRFLPPFSNDNVKTSLWGVGIKHDIKQWIPGAKALPFSLSVMLGYTKFKLDYSFDKGDRVYPNSLVGSTTESPLSFASPEQEKPDYYANQGFKLESSSLMVNAIISKTFIFFTPYLGVGFSQNNFKFNFTGNYPVLGDPNYNTDTKKVGYSVNVLQDPVNIEYKTFMPSATIGFKLKFLGIVSFHAQYTIQEYSSANVGLGFGFR